MYANLYYIVQHCIEYVLFSCNFTSDSLNGRGTTAMFDGLMSALKEVVENGQHTVVHCSTEYIATRNPSSSELNFVNYYNFIKGEMKTGVKVMYPTVEANFTV